ncbi:hypothetical protein [Actinoplanes aureus]|jgi:hypothetical protein|uniref:Uncharacterized protein n=1 Tax=Actinoplanes aureus TaxID=2792083 RepID=A0A931C6P1_9ACTN|nr:hypothetical protein [Actinoplanes aureus]MBG0561996.1 hypothetical protein [Actinoplanes aureus]
MEDLTDKSDSDLIALLKYDATHLQDVVDHLRSDGAGDPAESIRLLDDAVATQEENVAILQEFARRRAAAG